MFSQERVIPIVFTLANPGASKDVPFFKVSSRSVQIEILSAFVVADIVLAAGTANGRELSLLNMGTSGTATNAVSGTIGAVAAGTYPAWVANAPVALSITAGTLTTSQYLGLRYTLTGSDSSAKNFVVQVQYVVGRGT